MINTILSELRATKTDLQLHQDELLDFGAENYNKGYVDGVDYAIRVVEWVRKECQDD